MKTEKDKFRAKVKTLRIIIKEYSEHFKNFKNATCFARGKDVTIVFYGGKKWFMFKKKTFPKRDIDKIILRYRSRVKYYNNKDVDKNTKDVSPILR